jgi:hypothetical protein
MGTRESNLSPFNDINSIASIYKDFINKYNFSIDSIDNVRFNYNKCNKYKNILNLYFDVYHYEFTSVSSIAYHDLDELKNILNDNNYIFKEFKINNNQLILSFNYINNQILHYHVYY